MIERHETREKQNEVSAKHKVLQNDYQQTFVSDTVPSKTKRDRVKENRHKKRHRIKERRENIRMIERQKRNETREKQNEVSAKHKVLQNDYQQTFVSDTVPSKTKRDRVKENRHKKRHRIKERRENIRMTERQKRNEAKQSESMCVNSPPYNIGPCKSHIKMFKGIYTAKK